MGIEVEATPSAAAAPPIEDEQETIVEEPEPAAPAPELQGAAAIHAAVAAWHAGLRDTPLSRSTEAWNHLTASLPSLEAALAAALTPASLTPRP